MPATVPVDPKFRPHYDFPQSTTAEEKSTAPNPNYLCGLTALARINSDFKLQPWIVFNLQQELKQP